MRARDYFCGAGGASLGLTAAGYDVHGYDAWSTAVRTHLTNGLPATVLDLSDPADSADARLFPLSDCLDVLDRSARVAWFSTPCQPFSTGGLGDGEFDDRDGFPWAVRILAHTLPDVAIFENVKGITSTRHAGYFARVLDSIRAVGYVVEHRVLSAADFGVPQTRHRCFIVARRDGHPIVWPTPTHGPGRAQRWVSMADVLGWRSTDVVGFPRAADDGATVTLSGSTYRQRDLYPASGPAPTLTEKGRSWSRFVLDTQQSRPADGGGRERILLDVTDRPAPTVTAQVVGSSQWVITDGEGGPAPIRVSIDELARLQDFPPGYVWCGTRSDQALQIGNAVPPTMARLLSAANRPVD